MTTLQLLIVEDNPDDADLLLRELRRAGFDPAWSRVETEPDFLAALQNPPEIILSDYSMPHFSGLRALELLRASGRDIPFILISGTVGEDVAVQAMRDGATDYLLKDRPARLANAVKRALAETRLRVERNQVEAAQARLAAIVTSSDDAIIGKTLDGTITSWNAGAERIFGYTPAEAVGQPMLMLFPLDRIDEEPDMLARVARGETVRHFETVRVRKDGACIDVSVTLSPLVDHDGHIVGASKIARDITERKRGEEEFRERAQLTALAADVGLALSADTLTQALRQCAEALVTHLGAAFARIWTLNEREGVLELQASAGLYTHLNGPHGRVPVGEFKIGRIVRDRKPHLTNSVVSDPEVSDQAWARREGMVAFAGHPLMVGDRVVGVLALFARHALSDSVISALASVADHIALGIDRHRGIETVRTTEERMRFALQNADVGIWDMDYTTGVLRWSETIEAHYGVQPGTFGGTFDAFVERIHPDDRASLLETVGNAMKSGADFSTLNRSIWPDGTVRWLSGAGRIYLGEHGEPVRGVGISQDVTGRKQADETRARLAAIVESSDDAIFSTAPDETILTWNAGAERLYGYTANDVIGRSLALTVPAGKVAELATIMERVARGASGEPVETQRTRKDGSMVDVSLTISPMTNFTGRVIGASMIARDITRRLKAEAELTRLNHEIQLQRLRVFKATIRTVQDIVNNLLNGFQLVRLEGEGQLSAELLMLVDQMVREAGVKLKTLGDLETVNEKEMTIGMGIDYPGAAS